jgi:hypothetical protein
MTTKRALTAKSGIDPTEVRSMIDRTPRKYIQFSGFDSCLSHGLLGVHIHAESGGAADLVAAGAES